MTRITQQQLESYLWGAAVLLRGTIDAGDYKQFIFPLLFFKRLCDVFDEETAIALKESGGDEEFAAYPENHRFQIPEASHWKNVREAAKNVGAVLQSAMRSIETANPDKLYGIFGDAQWTNKDRLSDAMLRDLVEHFSTLELTVANLPEDELGQGYEYLIKKFADDSGHTAAEFYTNRTVVHLMTEMLDVQPGESVYDPTCGSGGMLLSCVTHLRKQKKESRNVKLYGQERNLMTSSIARMNCFLHGIEDFRIERGDTLAEPKLVAGDQLQQFDVVLANPPYSIKQWDRDAFAADPWGRNLYGTPPQGRADYAFQQHILQSLKPKRGRCAVLWPHGILFRNEENEIRRKFIESDYIEAVIGLGPNLFYNSSMQSCIVVCRTSKPPKQRNKVLFIDASKEITRERAQSFLALEHTTKVLNAYRRFECVSGFATVATLKEIKANAWSLNIPLYVKATGGKSNLEVSESEGKLDEALESWIESARTGRSALTTLMPELERHEHVLRVRPCIGDFIQSLDRNSWRRVRLAEVCDEMSVRVDNPADSGQDRFVGLEHFDSGELKIRRWGTTSNLESSMKAFSSGDVLFARRNAYLKRASLADFDGLCSGDAIVLRENRDVIVPGFLTFILNTDRFWEFAIANAAGTMSRRVNGKTLMRYEFDLPPLDQQRRIAEILWATDLVVQSWRTCANQHSKSLFEFLSAITLSGTSPTAAQITPIGAIPQTWRCLRLKDLVLSSAYGPRFSASQYSPDGNVKQIRTTDFTDSGEVDFSSVPAARLDDDTISNHLLLDGDFLLSRSGQQAGLAAVFREPADGMPYVAGAFLIKYRLGPGLTSDYLLALCQGRYGEKFVRTLVQGGDQKNISGSDFLRIHVPVPSIDLQYEIVSAISDFRKTGSAIADHLIRSSSLIGFILNSVL